jgi:hypothetical protein
MTYLQDVEIDSRLKVWQQLVDGVTANVNAAFGPTTYTPPVAAAVRRWDELQRLLPVPRGKLTGLAILLDQIHDDTDRTPDARRRAMLAAVDEADVTGTLPGIERIADEILSGLREASLPARPEPQDAAQEAKLAGLKTDLRMVLDSYPSDALAGPVGERLSSALDRGDALLSWLLASSGWMRDYLVSRRAEDSAASVVAAVDAALDAQHGLGARVRRLYRALADPQDGLPILEVAARMPEQVVDDLRGSSGPAPVVDPYEYERRSSTLAQSR